MTVTAMNPDLCIKIFFESINDYHKTDDVNAEEKNPYDLRDQYIENLLYKKNWIDTVQWHLEDIIRDPRINPEAALAIKRRIDDSNQKRNDTVEKIDEWLIQIFNNLKITPQKNARLNSESPAWIIDRISILCLKIYHMEMEINRKDAAEDHKTKCRQKLKILNEQLQDLSTSLSELLEDIRRGDKYMKVYRQMKMYNDPAMNPVLYKDATK